MNTYDCADWCASRNVWRIGSCNCHNAEIDKLRKLVRKLGAENDRLTHGKSILEHELKRVNTRLKDLEKALVRDCKSFASTGS